MSVVVHVASLPLCIAERDTTDSLLKVTIYLTSTDSHTSPGPALPPASGRRTCHTGHRTRGQRKMALFLLLFAFAVRPFAWPFVIAGPRPSSPATQPSSKLPIVRDPLRICEYCATRRYSPLRTRSQKRVAGQSPLLAYVKLTVFAHRVAGFLGGGPATRSSLCSKDEGRLGRVAGFLRGGPATRSSSNSKGGGRLGRVAGRGSLLVYVLQVRAAGGRGE